MEASGVVEAQIAPDGGSGLQDAGGCPQVDLFVCNGPPKALDEDVVALGRFAVGADPDLSTLQHLDEVGGGERPALVGFENVGLAVTRECLPDSSDAKIRLPRDRHPPGQNPRG